MIRLLLQELRFRRNAMVGWAVGLSLLTAIYVGFYPTFESQLENMQAIMELSIYQAMGMSFGAFEDWIASSVITLVPVILAIYAVIDGTGTLAGEEDAGKLELIITLPIPRWQIVTIKAIAHGIALFFILLVAGSVSTGVFLAIEDQITVMATDLAASDVLFAVLAAWPLVFALGIISLFLGTFCPNRRIAATLGTVFVIASYFASNLASQLESLESLKFFSLYTYYDSTATAFSEGQQTGDMAVYLVIIVIAFALTLFFFQRRNITVGVWPWQRANGV